MNGNFKYTISDAERCVLADHIDEKETARLATRKEIRSFLQGCLDAAIGDPGDVSYARELPESQPLPPRAQREVERLRSEGKDDSYIRGVLKVMLRNRGA